MWQKFYLLSVLLTLSACSEPQGNNTLFSLGNETFSQAAWRVADDSTRGEMVDSFLESHDVIGMNREVLLGFLGEPTGYYEYDHDLAYFIGGDRQSLYGQGHLLVFFIKEGVITEYRIIPEIESHCLLV
ncbi:hypothetical protein [Photobacterium galatheae]|uniref:Lipoprotein SmpA/OmlA domain-containing protein n=1 Tax=Photobacterium galatheae TaxID=1654360 RepID=A0A066RRC3_9GAMM|nr:hypothetical protein [Photobacterium galatheae]KDM92919.1 hypothetical protein EA58_03960 [Photobacterium galatheae]MCM0148116.1 hypothetical protein [Photobacterium galatheae]